MGFLDHGSVRGFAVRVGAGASVLAVALLPAGGCVHLDPAVAVAYSGQYAFDWQDAVSPRYGAGRLRLSGDGKWERHETWGGACRGGLFGARVPDDIRGRWAVSGGYVELRRGFALVARLRVVEHDGAAYLLDPTDEAWLAGWPGTFEWERAYRRGDAERARAASGAARDAGRPVPPMRALR